MGKTSEMCFFDVFRRAEQESEVRLPKNSLVAEISELLTLFVRDCRAHANSTTLHVPRDLSSVRGLCRDSHWN